MIILVDTDDLDSLIEASKVMNKAFKVHIKDMHDDLVDRLGGDNA